VPNIADNYPAGAFDGDSCFSIGHMGGCGEDCKVLHRGECDIEEEMFVQIGIWPNKFHGPDWPPICEEPLYMKRLADDTY
jgi:hypothetical protein